MLAEFYAARLHTDSGKTERQREIVSACGLSVSLSLPRSVRCSCGGSMMRWVLNRQLARRCRIAVRDAAVAHGPEFGGLEKCVPRGQAANDDAGAAVEPAAAEHVKLQESERGM